MVSNRFKHWQTPEFNNLGMTKWNWICQHHETLKLGKNTDIGAFTYINAEYGVEIGDNVQIGSHCSIYSVSTIDNKNGLVRILKNAKIGSHSLIMPGITIGEGAVIGAFSFVNKDVQASSIVHGIPARIYVKSQSK